MGGGWDALRVLFNDRMAQALYKPINFGMRYFLFRLMPSPAVQANTDQGYKPRILINS